MTKFELLWRLDLHLGDKIVDTKTDKIIRTTSNVYTLVEDSLDVYVFKNPDGWMLNVLYVLAHMNTKRSRFQPYKEKKEKTE